MLKPNQIRDMTIEEIQQQLHDKEEEYFNLKFRRSFQQIENPLRIRNLRRELALLKTILNENKLEIRTLKASSEKVSRESKK